MEKITLDAISFGFDIATAISILGAAGMFIRNSIKENRKKIGEERNLDRAKNLKQAYEIFSEKIDKIDNSKADENAILQLTIELSREIAWLQELMELLIISASNETIEKVENVSNKLKKLFLRDTPPAVNEIHTATSSALLEILEAILLEVRELMFNEDKATNQKAVKKFIAYKYRTFIFLAKKTDEYNEYLPKEHVEFINLGN